MTKGLQILNVRWQ